MLSNFQKNTGRQVAFWFVLWVLIPFAFGETRTTTTASSDTCHVPQYPGRFFRRLNLILYLV